MRCCDCEFRHMCNEEEKVLTAFARCEKRDLFLYEKQELKTYERSIIKTNADLIKAMNDDELAKIMMCPNEAGLAEISCDRSDACDCYKCLLNWLQQEAST